MRTSIVDRDIWTITVWYNPKKDDYYYKLLSSSFFEDVGYVNQYKHKLILKIDVYKDLIKYKNTPLYLKILKKVIRFLQNLDNKFSKKY